MFVWLTLSYVMSAQMPTTLITHILSVLLDRFTARTQAHARARSLLAAIVLHAVRTTDDAKSDAAVGCATQSWVSSYLPSIVDACLLKVNESDHQPTGSASPRSPSVRSPSSSGGNRHTDHVAERDLQLQRLSFLQHVLSLACSELSRQSTAAVHMDNASPDASGSQVHRADYSPASASCPLYLHACQQTVAAMLPAICHACLELVQHGHGDIRLSALHILDHCIRICVYDSGSSSESTTRACWAILPATYAAVLTRTVHSGAGGADGALQTAAIESLVRCVHELCLSQQPTAGSHRAPWNKVPRATARVTCGLAILRQTWSMLWHAASCSRASRVIAVASEATLGVAAFALQVNAQLVSRLRLELSTDSKDEVQAGLSSCLLDLLGVLRAGSALVSGSSLQHHELELLLIVTAALSGPVQRVAAVPTSQTDSDKSVTVPCALRAAELHSLLQTVLGTFVLPLVHNQPLRTLRSALVHHLMRGLAHVEQDRSSPVCPLSPSDLQLLRHVLSSQSGMSEHLTWLHKAPPSWRTVLSTEPVWDDPLQLGVCAVRTVRTAGASTLDAVSAPHSPKRSSFPNQPAQPFSPSDVSRGPTSDGAVDDDGVPVDVDDSIELGLLRSSTGCEGLCLLYTSDAADE